MTRSDGDERLGPRAVRRAAALVALTAAIGCLLAARNGLAVYALKKGVTSGGGSIVSGGSYRLGLTVGETGVSGFVGNATRRLGAGFWPGQFWQVSGLPEDRPGVSLPPLVNRLDPGQPNPFHGGTRFTLSVARPAPVRLRIYDVTGRRVATLVDGPRDAGVYVAEWNGESDSGAPVAGGIYFARLEVGTWSQSMKLIKLR